MSTIKISSKVEEETWNSLKALAEESQQNISGVLTEAIAEYVQRRRIRPVVLDAMKASIEENRELGQLLAQ